MGFDPKTAPIYRLSRDEQKADPAKTVAKILEDNPVKVLVIEGLDMWVPGGKISDLQVVSELMDQLQYIADWKHISIIGTLGSPKTKAKDGYALQRDQILGSVAWGRKSETVVVMSLHDPSDPKSPRDVWILPRNEAPEKFTLGFGGDGRLTEVDIAEPAPVGRPKTPTAAPEGTEATQRQLFRAGVLDYTPRSSFKWNEPEGDLSKAVRFRVLADLASEGEISRGKGGLWFRESR
jgi:hypothetical protein